MHDNESVRCKPMQTYFWQPALILSVDHASDAMIDSVPETSTVSLMEVHFFTEYHGSTEQDYINMAKGCEEESTINNDTHQRRGHNICCQLHC